MKFDYMADQRHHFPQLDHWSQIWWAIVNEIVDNKWESTDAEWFVEQFVEN